MTARDVLDAIADVLGIAWLNRPRDDALYLDLVIDQIQADLNDPYDRLFSEFAERAEPIEATYRPVETVAIAGGRL